MEKSLKKIQSKSQSGLSLIELAFIIIIFGILTAPLLQTYRIYQQQEKKDKTDIAFNEIETALGFFFQANGRYPCPSNRSIAFGDPGHGRERCDIFVPMAPNTCQNGEAMCKMTGHPPTGAEPQGFIHRGGVPYVDLGIPMASMIDGYGNPITYSISQNFDNPDPAVMAMDSSLRRGAIRWEEVDLSATPPVTTLKNNYIYTLVSSGPDGNGTYDIYGNIRPCGAVPITGENCDLDFVYRDSPPTEGNPADQRFDDRIIGLQMNSSSIWMYSMVTDGAIYNTNPGPVGVGTKNPNPDVRLDVAGDMKVNRVRSDLFCDANGENCMRTEVIAGPTAVEGLNACSDGEYIVGVWNNVVRCAPMVLDVNKGQMCGANEFIVGIKSNGDIECGTITP